MNKEDPVLSPPTDRIIHYDDVKRMYGKELREKYDILLDCGVDMKEFLLERLPNKIYASDDYHKGQYVVNKFEAIEKKHISFVTQAQDPIKRTIVVDVDLENARDYYDLYKNQFRPTFFVENPKNGHAHFIYLLNDPIKPEQKGYNRLIGWRKKIKLNLTLQLQGDLNMYSNLFKNPLHPDWITEFNPELFDLETLDYYCDKKYDCHKKVEQYESIKDFDQKFYEGQRLKALFDIVRIKAYNEVRKLHNRGDLTPTNLEDKIREYAEDFNKNRCIPPMDDKRVELEVLSIFGFCWRGQQRLIDLQYLKKPDLTERYRAGAIMTNKIRKADTEQLIINARNKIKSEGRKVTGDEISKITGRSRKTISKYPHLWKH